MVNQIWLQVVSIWPTEVRSPSGKFLIGLLLLGVMLDSTPAASSTEETWLDDLGHEEVMGVAEELTPDWTLSPGIDMGAVQQAMLSRSLQSSVLAAWIITRQEPTSTASLMAADVLFISPAGQTGAPLPYRDDYLTESTGRTGVLLGWQQEGVGIRTVGARITTGADQTGTIDLDYLRGQLEVLTKFESAFNRPAEPADRIRRNLMIDTQASLILHFVSDKQGFPKSYDDLLGLFDLRPLGSGVPVDSGAVPRAGALLLEAHDDNRVIRWRSVDDKGTYRLRSRVRFDDTFQPIRSAGGPGTVHSIAPEEHLQSAGWRTIATFQL